MCFIWGTNAHVRRGGQLQGGASRWIAESIFLGSPKANGSTRLITLMGAPGVPLVSARELAACSNLFLILKKRSQVIEITQLFSGQPLEVFLSARAPAHAMTSTSQAKYAETTAFHQQVERGPIEITLRLVHKLDQSKSR